jgi:hypothetical protein
MGELGALFPVSDLRDRALLLLLAGIAALVWFFRGERAAPATVRPALTVQTVQPRRESLPTTLAANGNIMAWQEASVGTEAAGLRLTQVRANVGDRVRKGEVLAVLSGDTVRADLAQLCKGRSEAEAAAARVPKPFVTIIRRPSESEPVIGNFTAFESGVRTHYLDRVVREDLIRKEHLFETKHVIKRGDNAAVREFVDIGSGSIHELSVAKAVTVGTIRNDR